MTTLIDVYLASRPVAEFERLVSPSLQVTPAPHPNIGSIAFSSEPAISPLPAQGPDAWRAEWGASAELQSEFPDANGYVALRKAETSGRVKVISRPSTVQRATTPDDCRAEWNASSELRSEFPEVGDYLALRKGESGGRIKLYHR